jgi:hypothetical protein
MTIAIATDCQIGQCGNYSGIVNYHHRIYCSQSPYHTADFKVHSMGQCFLNWILILQRESVSALLVGGWSSLGGVELSWGKEFIWMAMNVTMWWNIKTKFSYQQSLDSKLVWQSTRGQNFKNYARDSRRTVSHYHLVPWRVLFSCKWWGTEPLVARGQAASSEKTPRQINPCFGFH